MSDFWVHGTPLHSNMVSFSRSQPARETLDFQFMEDNSETLDFQFGQNMENNSETLEGTQSPLFDASFFNLNATPLTTKHPENSMHETDNPVDDGNFQTPTATKKLPRRGTEESKVRIGLMEGPDLPEWLPQGWQLERKKRENGVNAGMVETFYYDPEKGQKFRSKSEVLLFLESGTRRKRKSRQRRPKEILLAEPTDNFNIHTQASTPKSYIGNQPELAPHASSIENLNPVSCNETVPKQTMDDQNADFEERVSKPDNLEDGIVQASARPTVAVESLAKTRSVKSWHRKLGIIEGVDLPEWLPKGWKMERNVRQNGASAGKIDVVYTDPEKDCRFYSKVAVLRYLETGIGRIRPKRAKPANNLKPPTRRRPSSKRSKKTASKADITDQAEPGSRVGDDIVAGQTMHDWDADFTITEVGTSIQS